MNISISYRHLESSPAIDDKINEKLEHLKKYFHGKMDVSWVCSVDGHKQHRSEVNVSIAHDKFHAHAVDTSLYNTLDIVLSKLESQMRKKSEKIKGLNKNKTKIVEPLGPSYL